MCTGKLQDAILSWHKMISYASFISLFANVMPYEKGLTAFHPTRL